MKWFKYFMMIAMLSLFLPALEDAAAVLAKIDGFRQVALTFAMDVRMLDYDGETLKDEALFRGFFAGNDRSLLLCASGRNQGMKVLMKGDDMWVNLNGSKRALRITPMQRLMGQASNGDVAKISFGLDYSGTLLGEEGDLLKLDLRAKSVGATYQRVLLYADKKSYRPVKAEFFLLSGKHFKTAHYTAGLTDDGKPAITRVKIEDKLNPNLYTVMEYLGYKPRQLADKIFNVMYLSQVEVE